MRKALAYILAAWAFVADTAQILGVDWKAVAGIAIGTGGGAWLIGFLTEVGHFQLAIGVAAVMFFVAGASAFSRYKKSSIQSAPASVAPSIQVEEEIKKESEAFQKVLEKRARENRQHFFSSTPAKPRYAPPLEAEQFPIGSLSFRDFGDKFIKLAKDQRGFIASRIGHYTDSEIVNDSMSMFVPRFLWLYEESKKRGIKDTYIEHYYNHPDELHTSANLSDLAKHLEKFGNLMKLYS
jgi:hypothetical protein